MLIKKLKDFKNKFFFNGMIRSISIAYLKTSIAVGVQMILFADATQSVKNENLRATKYTIGFLVFVPFITTIFLWKYQDSLDYPRMRAKYQNMYKIYSPKTKKGLYNFPMFLNRRLIFVLVSCILFKF